MNSIPQASPEHKHAQSGIYLITNTTDGKQYVGSSVDMPKRWRIHLNGLRRNTHRNIHLQRAFNRDGESAFTFTILECCSAENLTAREQHWIDALNTVQQGYNIAPQAGSQRGKRLTPEQRQRCAERQTQMWADPAYREQQSAHLANRFDTDLRDKIATSVQALWADPEYKANWVRKMRAKTDDPAYREQMRQRAYERYSDPAEREKIAAGNRRRFADPAERQRAADLIRARSADPAYRERLSQRARERFADPERRALALQALAEGRARSKARKAAQ